MRDECAHSWYYHTVVACDKTCNMLYKKFHNSLFFDVCPIISANLMNFTLSCYCFWRFFVEILYFIFSFWLIATENEYLRRYFQ